MKTYVKVAVAAFEQAVKHLGLEVEVIESKQTYGNMSLIQLTNHSTVTHVPLSYEQTMALNDGSLTISELDKAIKASVKLLG